jgi:hypothetical protein
MARAGPRRRLAQRPIRVAARRRRLQRGGIDVGREDRQPPVLEVSEQPVEQHRQRVRLLARGAAGAPQREPEIARGAPPGDQLRQDLLAEHREQPGVAEEVALANRQRAGQRAPLWAARRLLAQHGEQREDSAGPGGGGQRALEIRAAAGREVEPEPARDERVRAVHDGRRKRHLAMAASIAASSAADRKASTS